MSEGDFGILIAQDFLNISESCQSKEDKEHIQKGISFTTATWAIPC